MEHSPYLSVSGSYSGNTRQNYLGHEMALNKSHGVWISMKYTLLSSKLKSFVLQQFTSAHPLLACSLDDSNAEAACSRSSKSLFWDDLRYKYLLLSGRIGRIRIRESQCDISVCIESIVVNCTNRSPSSSSSFTTQEEIRKSNSSPQDKKKKIPHAANTPRGPNKSLLRNAQPGKFGRWLGKNWNPCWVPTR